MAEVGNIFVRIGANIDSFKRAMKDLEANIKQIEDSFDGLSSVGDRMTDVGKSLTAGITLPLATAGGAALKTAIDFESAFAGVRKTVDASEETLASLREEIRQMAREMPASAVEIAGVAEAAGQLGIQTENIIGFTRTMIDLGVATNMTAEEAATALARLANITQMPQEQFDRLGATIVELGNNLATTEAEIVEMGLRIAGAGAQIGLAESEILALAGALSSVGIEAEAGGTAISRVMITIANAVQEGGEQLGLFAKVAGMSVNDFKQAFQEDAAGAIITFIEGLARMSAEGENVFTILDELGLSEIRVRDALLRASGAGDLFRQSLEMANQAWDENIALTKEAEQRYGTTESQLIILWNRIKDIGITLGDALIPVLLDFINSIQPVIDAIARAAEWFAALDPAVRNVILVIAGLAAALGPVLIVIGTLLNSLSTIATFLPTLKGAFMALTGPIGLVIAAVAALAAIAYVVYQNWDNITAWLRETWENLKAWAISTFEAMGEGINNALDWLREAWANFRDRAIEIFEQVVEYFRNLPDRIMSFLSSLPDRMAYWAGYLVGQVLKFFAELPGKTLNFLRQMVNHIINSFRNAYRRGTETVKNLIDRVVQFFRELPGRVAAFVQDMANRVATWFTQARDQAVTRASELISRVSEWFKSLPGRIASYLSSLPGRVGSIFSDVWNAIWRRISSWPGKLWSKAKQIASNFWEGFKKGLGISSPSYVERAFMAIGEQAQTTMAQLQRLAPRMEPIMARLASPAVPLANAAALAPASSEESLSLSGRYEIVLQVDGREVARTTAPFLGDELERQRRLYSRARGER